MNSDHGLADFSARLNTLCDERKMPARGRAELLSKKFSVTREAARKWLKAKGYPTLAKRAELCSWFDVTDAWLMSGKGDKRPVSTNLSDCQRRMIEYMNGMSPDQQALAVRLVMQLLDDTPTGGGLVTGSGRFAGATLHDHGKKGH